MNVLAFFCWFSLSSQPNYMSFGEDFLTPFFSSASTSAGGAHQNFPQTYTSESACRLIFTQLFLQQKQADRNLT